MVDRRNRIAGRERHELIALCVEERIVFNDERADPLPGKRCEARCDFPFGARTQDEQPSPERMRRCLHILRLRPCLLKIWVHEKGAHTSVWHQFVQQP